MAKKHTDFFIWSLNKIFNSMQMYVFTWRKQVTDGISTYTTEKCIGIVFFHGQQSLCILGEFDCIFSLRHGTIAAADTSTLVTAASPADVVTGVAPSITHLKYTVN